MRTPKVCHWQLASHPRPTIVIVRRENWACTVRINKKIAGRIVNDWLVVFEESGHLPQVEERATLRTKQRRARKELYSLRSVAMTSMIYNVRLLEKKFNAPNRYCYRSRPVPNMRMPDH